MRAIGKCGLFGYARYWCIHSRSKTIKRSNDFILRSVGGESLLVPIGRRVAHMPGVVMLNSTARCIWELLEQEQSFDELSATVAKQFAIDLDRARTDVRIFLDEMAQRGTLQQ